MQSFLQASLLWGIKWENEPSHALVEADEFGKAGGWLQLWGRKGGEAAERRPP